MRSTARFSGREWLLLVGFVLSLLLAVVFLVRSFHMLTRLHQEEPIEPWMTVPYVARSYRVPSSILYQALGLPSRPHDRRPLSIIAREQGRPVQDVIDDLQRAIIQARSQSPPSPPVVAPGSAS